MARRRGKGRWIAADDRLLSAVLGVGLALIFIVSANARLQPYLLASARADAQNRVTAAVTDAVDGPGAHDAAAVTHAAVSALETIRRGDVRLPLGNLTGLPILHGVGPAVRVRILTVGVVQTAVTETAYRIKIHLTVFLPWQRAETEFTTEIPK